MSEFWVLPFWIKTKLLVYWLRDGTEALAVSKLNVAITVTIIVMTANTFTNVVLFSFFCSRESMRATT